MSAVDPFAVLGILTSQIHNVADELGPGLAAMVAEVERIDPPLQGEAAMLVTTSLMDLFDALHRVQKQIRTAVDQLEPCMSSDVAPAATEMN